MYRLLEEENEELEIKLFEEKKAHAETKIQIYEQKAPNTHIDLANNMASLNLISNQNR